MKAYILTKADLKSLIDNMDRNPRHGYEGGSSDATWSQEKQMIYDEAHRFYNYQVRSWIDRVAKKD